MTTTVVMDATGVVRDIVRSDRLRTPRDSAATLAAVRAVT